MDWVPFALASIPAAVAIFAALTAARSARKTKQLEIQAQLIRDLENRLADKKYSTYEPMIDLLSGMLVKDGAEKLDPDEFQSKTAKFTAWLAIYGSDEALRAWHKFMQGAFNDAAGFILLRLYADFVLAARRDMGHPETSVSAVDVVGTRITDLYTRGDLREVLELDWSEMKRRTGWTPPWAAEKAELANPGGAEVADGTGPTSAAPDQ